MTLNRTESGFGLIRHAAITQCNRTMVLDTLP
jgi:hypothetical protein